MELNGFEVEPTLRVIKEALAKNGEGLIPKLRNVREEWNDKTDFFLEDVLEGYLLCGMES